MVYDCICQYVIISALYNVSFGDKQQFVIIVYSIIMHHII